MPFADSDEERQAERASPLGNTWEQEYQRAKRRLMDAAFSNENEFWSHIFHVLYTDPTKWRQIKEYRPEDVSCRIFGHVSPVFCFGSPGISETRDARQRGRAMPREIMLKVVRRDDYGKYPPPVSETAIGRNRIR